MKSTPRPGLLLALALASFLFPAALFPEEGLLFMDPPYTDSNRDGYWRRARPESSGLCEKILLAHIELCRATGADSQIVVSKGCIVSEWYSERYRLPVYAMSSTKAISSLLIGILLDRGLIGSIQDKAANYLENWRPGPKSGIRIEHLLTHTSGYLRKYERGESLGFEDDKTGFVLNLLPEARPGSRYSYSNEAVQLLDPIIEAASGKKTVDFAREALFEPLGMLDTSLNVDSKGHAWTYADMKTTTRDLARIGQLMLNEGRWLGRRVVGSGYIEKATSASRRNREMGYLWWILYLDGKAVGYYASGYLNTDIYVLPSKELVIVRTQAPKSGFTGEDESRGYAERARIIFAELLR